MRAISAANFYLTLGVNVLLVLEAYLATDQIIDGWSLAAHSWFQRFHEGGVRFGTLAVDLYYKGSTIPAGAHVVAERDGTISEFSTSVPYKSSTGTLFEPGRIGLDNDGGLGFWQPAH